MGTDCGYRKNNSENCGQPSGRHNDYVVYWAEIYTVTVDEICMRLSPHIRNEKRHRNDTKNDRDKRLVDVVVGEPGCRRMLEVNKLCWPNGRGRKKKDEVDEM